MTNQPVLHDGTMVTIVDKNPWDLPFGQYRLHHWENSAWELIDDDGPQAVYFPDVIEAVSRGILLPTAIND